MNAAQVIGSWWVNFSRSPVGQFCLLVCIALGLGERNGEQSERRLAFAAQRRTRGVGRAGVPGTRNAGTVGDGGAKPPERSATGGVRAGMSGAHDEGVKRSGSSGVTSGNATESRSGARHRPAAVIGG